MWLCSDFMRPQRYKRAVGGAAEMEDELFAGNEFLQQLSVVANKSPAEILALLAQCRSTEPATFASAVSSTTRESFREAPREAAELTPKRGPREASREAAEITPRRFQALVDGVAARIPDCMNDLGTIAAVEKALRLPQLISFELARGAIEGAVVSHAMSVIAGLPKTSFMKIGLTMDPAYRWYNADYGYETYLEPKFGGRFKRMVVLHGTASKEAAGMLEAALIAMVSAAYPERCCNVARGGEAKSKASTFLFVYCVVS